MGQDPYLLKTGSIEFTSPCLVALSPDGRSVAIANESTISVHNAISGEQEEKMSNVFSGTCLRVHILTLLFSSFQ